MKRGLIGTVSIGKLRFLRSENWSSVTRGHLRNVCVDLPSRGECMLLGGRDPQAQWCRSWDGRWRIVLFDVPTGQNARRVRLQRYLRGRSFGCLQGSVWVTPDPLNQERKILAGGKVNVESLLLLEARPCAGESDAEIVAGAWNFMRINRGYEQHLQVLEKHPRGSLRTGMAAKALCRWASAEREAWLAAVTADPLLPEPLLPRGHMGRRAWERRIQILRDAGRQLHTYRA
jgi:phenylacetic acid degradation operon negative regulatory protein